MQLCMFLRSTSAIELVGYYRFHVTSSNKWLKGNMGSWGLLILSPWALDMVPIHSRHPTDHDHLPCIASPWGHPWLTKESSVAGGHLGRVEEGQELYVWSTRKDSEENWYVWCVLDCDSELRKQLHSCLVCLDLGNPQWVESCIVNDPIANQIRCPSWRIYAPHDY